MNPTARILDGKIASQALLADLVKDLESHIAQGGKRPHLVAILVGNDGASETYVASKIKHCKELGFESSLIRFEETVTEAALLESIARINQDAGIHGLIVQMPLPKHIDPDKIIESILPEKDVDGFHPINFGRMAKGLPAFISATPLGVVKLMEYYGIQTQGRSCVVIGRSQNVGLPMSLLMQRNDKGGNATVTLCHSKTPDMAAITREADIVIAALGKPAFVTGDMIKPGAVVIDIGLTRVPDASKKSGFRLQGDVDFDSVAAKASAITPVPGGVGLMTIYGLLHNTFEAAKRQSSAK